jgi:hypothetical protein
MPSKPGTAPRPKAMTRLAGFSACTTLTTRRSIRPAARRPVNDQVRFFTETMRDFNLAMVKYLREDLGCKQLIAG